jgi:hypothetical protein
MGRVRCSFDGFSCQRARKSGLANAPPPLSLAARGSPEAFFLPLQTGRGTARRPARRSPSARTVAGAWRLSARHRGVLLPAPGRALLAVRVALPPARSSRPLVGGRSFRASGRPSRPAVSQLLAGGPSAPGRSPGAARGREERSSPARGRRILLHHPTPHDDALDKQNAASLNPVSGGGDKFSRKCDYYPSVIAGPLDENQCEAGTGWPQ